ncbi:D-TA family PLP-dependent enzyme [Chitinophaga sp.]|uniref:D-TA family PLP-dependent enzyme n=1 Tax=Chitinophaga sp. TaxID=1869181 RepID=UPI0026032826|nr:D-TA family PLP-dependent enzyme [uncultured Chitinophaga sp.]
MQPVISTAALPSPALLVFPERISENIRLMIRMAGGPGRLMPHVKTHKMAPVVRMQLDQGIRRFKCATLAEARMLAETGAPDILLAYQLNAPMAQAFVELQQQYPASRFASLADNTASARLMNDLHAPLGTKARLYIDIDDGMRRTGITSDKAAPLWRELQALPNVEAAGLHVYDGHIRAVDIEERTRQCDEAFAAVEQLAADIHPPEIIAGGTPTFPIHARRAEITLSPGTCLLWDEGYGTGLPDQPFVVAAQLLTRVISKPQEGHVTLDLGHKAVSAENPITRRVFFPALKHYEVISQSEEHLVVKTPEADTLQVGDVLYGTPWHVCPTVALYNEALVIENGSNTGTWAIARGRLL